MKNIALEVENLSKQYRLGQVGTGTLSHDLNRWWHKIRGKEDPYLKIGEVNDRTKSGDSDYVWALQDVNFKIEQGDAVGIIGRNGAGKSTLLKLLSKVTKPTTGNIKVKGRIASLLEVGTGFHPEMTGRENIFLNGAILGMTRKEIKSKFDEIVDFAGVERYIDTPVKRYSSGMYVRLAFAVAAHLESEILIVDEVLAVGDAEFQKKCLGKMGDVSKGEGRTVLFVSHSMASVRKLCNKGIILQNGKSILNGPIDSVVSYYENEAAAENKVLDIFYNSNTKLPMQIDHVSLICLRENKVFYTNDQLSFKFKVRIDEVIEGAYITIDLKDMSDQLIYWSGDYNSKRFKDKLVGEFELQCDLPKGILSAGLYNVSFAIYSPTKGIIHNEYNNIISFEIEERQDSYLSQFNINYPGKTALESEWSTIIL